MEGDIDALTVARIPLVAYRYLYTHPPAAESGPEVSGEVGVSPGRRLFPRRRGDPNADRRSLDVLLDGGQELGCPLGVGVAFEHHLAEAIDQLGPGSIVTEEAVELLAELLSIRKGRQ